MVNSFASSGALAQLAAGLIGELVTSRLVWDNAAISVSVSSNNTDVISILLFTLVNPFTPLGFFSSSTSTSPTSVIMQPTPGLFGASWAAKINFSTFSSADTMPSQSIMATPILTAPGCVPSTTYKFGLSLVGGQLEPGQCHTIVFLPDSAATFQNGSALHILESSA